MADRRKEDEDLKETVPSKSEQKEIEKLAAKKESQDHRDEALGVKDGKVVPKAEAEKVEGKREKMKLVALHDEKGVVQNVKTERGDVYSVEQIQTFIRAGIPVVIDFNGKEVPVNSTGVGIEAREGTTSLLGTLQAFVP